MMKPTFPFSWQGGLASMYPQFTPPLGRWVRNHRHLLPPLLLLSPPFRTNFLAPLVSKVCPECPDATPARPPARPTSLALGPRPPSRARNARPESMIGATRGRLGGFPFPDKFRCHYFGSIAFNTVREVVQRTECGSAADLLRIRKLFPLFLHLLRFFFRT